MLQRELVDGVQRAELRDVLAVPERVQALRASLHLPPLLLGRRARGVHAQRHVLREVQDLAPRPI